MLIRSQDKSILINMNNVSQLYTVGFCITADFADNRDSGFRDMGNYSSEEKAIKVLDMIQDNYAKLDCVHHGVYIHGDCDSVFQMPQDSEVEV